jgi:transposase
LISARKFGACSVAPWADRWHAAVLQPERVMKVNWKNPADSEQLRKRIAEQTGAKQRDRYRVVLIAGEGLGGKSELQREEIAAVVGRSRQFVDLWVGRYRSGGIEALVAKRQKGNKPALTEDQQKRLCELLDRGPTPEEGLAAYNGPIIKQKPAELFGKTLALGSVYRILHRLGYNDLMPRTTHPGSSPETMEAFKKKSFQNVWLGSGQNTPARKS